MWDKSDVSPDNTRNEDRSHGYGVICHHPFSSTHIRMCWRSNQLLVVMQGHAGDVALER